MTEKSKTNNRKTNFKQREQEYTEPQTRKSIMYYELTGGQCDWNRVSEKEAI